MSHLQVLLWMCVAAYGAHILKEFVFDWRNWSQQVLHLPTRWDDFYITNCLVIVVAITAAMIAPEISRRGVRVSSPHAYQRDFHAHSSLHPETWSILARTDHVSHDVPAARLRTMMAAELNVTGFAVGAALLAMPISFVMLRNKPYFDQTRPY